ncbi:aldehyde dehydrogenase family protein [Deinococcus sp. KSM4-11]|uniref:aldehyde dehydrogenase family protein n=1 Tax=Deinococcus sp. KSM4-11 TaxID=2568654 RepID=UPI0010A59B24|nr:aldehyde dehydrogenase family protein [Deinococcus sp. KSM4-11]THF85042.1 aldehyde dehydrogenase family protein [Deinococcus sp. KSM4-11]
MSSGLTSPPAPDLDDLFARQLGWRWAAAQTGAAERQILLRRLHDAVRSHRRSLLDALHSDLHKSRAEAELTELHPVLEEIAHAVRHLPAWMTPRPVPTPRSLLGVRSSIQAQARGVTLILSPWNYPVNLSLSPLVASLAAGNTVILKPSEKAPRTAQALADLIQSTFDPLLVTVVLGDAEVARALTTLPFDHIFFTGSGAVGREVMRAAAANLTSVTLELGGKSPALIDASADLPVAAERIAYGKLMNAGQTCVAPDYVLVPAASRDTLVDAIKDVIARRYGEPGRVRAGPDYGRMVDAPSVERLERLTRQSVTLGARIALGGVFDPAGRFISPTVVTDVTPDMPLMQEELFGPVLPILTYATLDEALDFIRQRDPPLALYAFAEDARALARIRAQTTSGGLVLNGTVIHLSNPNLPFGGVGPSGTGAYHGEHGFRTFSHLRAVLHEPRRSPVRLSYPPFDRPLLRAVTWLIRQTERLSGPRG